MRKSFFRMAKLAAVLLAGSSLPGPADAMTLSGSVDGNLPMSSEATKAVTFDETNPSHLKAIAQDAQKWSEETARWRRGMPADWMKDGTGAYTFAKGTNEERAMTAKLLYGDLSAFRDRAIRG